MVGSGGLWKTKRRDKESVEESHGNDTGIADSCSQRLEEGKEACNSSTANQAGI